MEEVIKWVLKIFQLFYRLHQTSINFPHHILQESQTGCCLLPFFVNLTDLNSLNLIQTDDIIKF